MSRGSFSVLSSLLAMDFGSRNSMIQLDITELVSPQSFDELCLEAVFFDLTYTPSLDQAALTLRDRWSR